MSTCTYENCDRPIDQKAIDADIPGCRVLCRFHLEQNRGMPLDEYITKQKAFETRVKNGELPCDICNKRGALPVPGEGQWLCDEHNHRRGINRWS